MSSRKCFTCKNVKENKNVCRGSRLIFFFVVFYQSARVGGIRVYLFVRILELENYVCLLFLYVRYVYKTDLYDKGFTENMKILTFV